MVEKVKTLREIYPADQWPLFDIGEGSYGGLRIVSWTTGARLSIGKFCSFSFGTIALLGGGHRVDWATTYPFPSLWEAAANIEGHPVPAQDTVIGNDVWVGTEAMILSGVKIGDGAVIASRAVVDRDVPPYAHVLGFPARVMKYRFDKYVITRLLQIKWWDWPKSRIEKALPFMLNTDIEGFLSRVESGEL